MAAGAGTTIEQLMLVLRADLTDLQKGLAQAAAHVKELQRQVQESSQAGQAQFQTFGSRVGGILTGMRSIFGGLGATMAAAIGTGIVQAIEMEAAMRRLQILVTNQGGAWAQNKVQVEAWAETLQRASGIAQVDLVRGLTAATMRGFSLAQSMAMVSAASKVSIATGRDMDGVLTALTYATQGYTRNLVRMGIITREEAARGIDFAIVLDRINKRFGETAEQGPPTLAKALMILKTSVGEMLGTLGKPFLEPLREAALWLATLAQKTEDWVKRLSPTTVQLAGLAAALLGGTVGMRSLIAPLLQGIPVLGNLTRMIAGLNPWIAVITGAITILAMAWNQNWFHMRDVLQPIITNIMTWLSQLKLHIADWVESLGNLVTRIGIFLKMPGVAEFGTDLVNMGIRLRRSFMEAQIAATTLGRSFLHIKPPIDATNQSLEELKKLFGDLKIQAGKVKDPVKELTDELRKTIDIQKTLYELGQRGPEAVIAAYKALISNVKVAKEDRYKAELELAQFIAGVTRDSVQNSMRWINLMREQGKLSGAELEAAFARVAQRINEAGLTAKEKAAILNAFYADISRIRSEDMAEEIDAIRERVAAMHISTEAQQREYLRQLQDLLKYYNERAAVDQTYAAARYKLAKDVAKLEREMAANNLTVIQQAALNTTEAMASGIGELVKNVARGTRTIGQAFDDVLNKVLDAWDTALAKMIQKWIESQLENVFASLFGGPAAGGYGGAAVASILPQGGYQTGGTVRAPTGARAVAALLHPGERVQTPAEQEKVVEPEERGPRGMVNVTIQAIDTQSGVEFLLRNRQAVGDALFAARRANHPVMRRIGAGRK